MSGVFDGNNGNRPTVNGNRKTGKQGNCGHSCTFFVICPAVKPQKVACWGQPQTPTTSGQVGPKWVDREKKMKYIICKWGDFVRYTTKEDLTALIEDNAVENISLEFKSYSFDDGKIPSKEKDDIVKEIVSFANSEGGNIIVGIDEDGKRVASKLKDVGCTMSQFDGIQLAIQQHMLAKVRPRLYGVKMYGILINDDRIAITIQVPKSYSRPHAINDGNKDVFYMRHSNGIAYMSVDDLRTQFLSSSSFKRDIQTFRQDRISMILANEALGTLLSGAKVLLHIIPLWSLEEGNNIDISNIPNNKMNIARPISGGGYNYSYNADGWFTAYNDHETKHISTYVQFFRNGIIEAVDVRMMNYEKNRIYKWEETESAVFEALVRYTEILDYLDIPKPWHIYLSFLNAKGFRSSGLYYDDGVIDRDIVHAVECVWNDDSGPISEVIKPAFDSLANSLGRAHSVNYDKGGMYIQRA